MARVKNGGKFEKILTKYNYKSKFTKKELNHHYHIESIIKGYNDHYFNGSNSSMKKIVWYELSNANKDLVYVDVKNGVDPYTEGTAVNLGDLFSSIYVSKSELIRSGVRVEDITECTFHSVKNEYYVRIVMGEDTKVLTFGQVGYDGCIEKGIPEESIVKVHDLFWFTKEAIEQESTVIVSDNGVEKENLYSISGILLYNVFCRVNNLECAITENLIRRIINHEKELYGM